MLTYSKIFFLGSVIYQSANSESVREREFNLKMLIEGFAKSSIKEG